VLLRNPVGLGLVLLVFLLFGCLQFESETVSKGPIKVGVILPLSGNGAVYGEWGKNALEIAKDEINGKGGINGRPIKLIFEDGKFNAQESVNAYNKLRRLDNVSYVITMGSSPAVAISPLANWDGVIQMDFSATTSAYRSKNDFTFRTAPKAEQFGVDTANWFVNHEQNEVNVLYINNDQGISIFNAFKDAYESAGGTIAGMESFEQDGFDFRTVIQKAVRDKDHYVFLIGHLKESGLVVRQMNEMGYFNPIFSHVYSVEGSDFLESARAFQNTIVYLAPVFDPRKNSAAVAYNESYQNRFGVDAEYFGTFAFDALNVLSVALSECENPIDTNCVKNELFQTADYPGLTGTISFDEFGDRQVDLALKTVKNGEFILYSEQ